MKKIIFLSFALFLFAATTVFAQNHTDIITDALRRSAEAKVKDMQRLIGFDDNQASQLKALESRFLLDVRQAENLRPRNSRRRIERLQTERNAALQQILTRAQFIKYDAVENNRIEDIPVRLDL
jgi:hypothetical protein